MLTSVDARRNYVDSALFLSPPGNWGDVVGAMKPGAHLLLFSSVKSHHVETIAAEDNGLEIRDTISYVFHDSENSKSNVAMKLVAVARKPLDGNVAGNVLKWGTGGLNIDKCRVEHVTVDGGNLALNPHLRSHINGGNGGHIISTETERRVVTPNSAGRWPANLLHDNNPSVVALFPNTGSGNGKGGYCYAGREYDNKDSSMFNGDKPQAPSNYNDNGTAARFFYSAPCLDNLITYLLKLITKPNGTVLTNCDKEKLPNNYSYVGQEL